MISNANAPDTFFKMVGYKHLPTPEIDPNDPSTQFHPGRLWQPPVGETPAKYQHEQRPELTITQNPNGRRFTLWVDDSAVLVHSLERCKRVGNSMVNDKRP